MWICYIPFHCSVYEYLAYPNISQSPAAMKKYLYLLPEQTFKRHYLGVGLGGHRVSEHMRGWILEQEGLSLHPHSATYLMCLRQTNSVPQFLPLWNGADGSMCFTGSGGLNETICENHSAWQKIVLCIVKSIQIEFKHWNDSANCSLNGLHQFT